MTEEDSEVDVHDLDVSLWIGKHGIGPVVDELTAQLEHHEYVKVKFLKAARTSNTTEELAVELATRVGGDVVETRGHTAVFSG